MKSVESVKNQGTMFFLPNPLSFGAHQKCYQMIKRVDSCLCVIIQGLYKNAPYNEQEWAYIRAIGALREACFPETIDSFFEKHGKEALSTLIRTVAIEAVKKIPSKL